jgi:hypothetical protein
MKFGFVTVLLLPAFAGADDRIDFFESRIRPILAQECYECHSAATKAKGGLLLDSRPGWEKGGDSGAAILPGKPEASLLLQSIAHEHEDLKMPKAGAKLDHSVLADFRKWIAEGAVDPRDTSPSAEQVAADTSWEAIAERRAQWWSFQPVVNPPVPDDARLSHPVDRFLEKDRKAAGMVASDLTDRWTVLRRLHAVLTGLPATLEEQAAFDRDWETLGRENAVAGTVESLLASPHFGERWAQHWLDWFRYTEGHGGQGDPGIENATEYRDYMIRALNANVPYDQLIREHLAGDLLPEPRLNPEGTINESIIGLAQFRFVEHGFFPVDALDELVKFTDNQIDVVTKATMGLTVSCARCHDHKFDAISHRDYHAMFGIFASSRPARRPVLAPGVIGSRRVKLQDAQADFAAAIKAHWLETISAPEIRKRLDAFAVRHIEWEKNPTKPVETLAGSEPVSQPLLVKPGDALEPWIRWQNDTDVSQQWEQWPAKLKALGSKAETHNQTITVERVDFSKGLPNGWLVTDGTIEPVKAGEIGLATDADGAVESILPSGLITHRTTTHEQAALFSPDFTVEGFDAIAANWSGGGWSSFRLVPQNFPRGGGGIYRQSESRDDGATRWFSEETDFWKGNRAYFHFQTRGTAPAPPTSPRDADGKPIPTVPQPHGSWFHVAEVRKLRGEKDKVQATRFSGNAFLSAGTTPVRDRDSLAARYAESIREVVNRWQTPSFTDEDALFLTEFLGAGILDGRRETIGAEAQSALASIRKIEGEFVASARLSTPAVVESAGFDQPFYERGNHLVPGDPVPRGFLKALGVETFALGQETGRRQLAEEVTAPENPFFHRVIANRLWLHVFGDGLVRTVDNFGRTGQEPTHPELLDHLATRFRTSGYDIKEAIRYLVTTELFQLSSEPTTPAKSQDPNNHLWTHAPVRRLDAEGVRDHLLAVSGRLDPRLYGPAILPNTAVDKDVRRGVYLSRRRALRDAFLDTFDMPLPASTRGQRDVTTTPSQAITLLNAPFVRHQAKTWAESKADVPVRDALQQLFSLSMSRPPHDEELDTLTEFCRANGGGVPGLTEAAHLVFNMKEFIYLP